MIWQIMLILREPKGNSKTCSRCSDGRAAVNSLRWRKYTFIWHCRMACKKRIIKSIKNIFMLKFNIKNAIKKKWGYTLWNMRSLEIQILRFQRYASAAWVSEKPEQCTTGQDRLMGKKAAQRRFLLLLMDWKCIRKIDFIFV